MKVILSRKGFDSGSGGGASPILPDGTLLSLPIPSEGDPTLYSDLQYGDINYSGLIKQIHPKKSDYKHCHLDPDLRADLRKNPIKDWKPAFGQISSAQGYLKNANVCRGDLFLFFGWFHKVKYTNKRYKFMKKNDSNDFYDISGLHIIYGYMEVGEIIKGKGEIERYYWHPHASERRLNKDTNTLYLPSKTLSFNPNLPGYGTLNFRKDRVLTMEGMTKAKWIPHKFLIPEKTYGNRKNSSKSGELYYAGRWQELVINKSPELSQWVNEIIA